MDELADRSRLDQPSAANPRFFAARTTTAGIAHHGVFDQGVQFIRKAFSRQEL